MVFANDSRHNNGDALGLPHIYASAGVVYNGNISGIKKAIR